MSRSITLMSGKVLTLAEKEIQTETHHSVFVVNINKTECTVRNKNGITVLLNRSLFADNHIAVKHGKTYISSSLYERWFSGTFNKPVYPQGYMQTLFLENFKLLCDSIELICSDSRMFFTPVPCVYAGGAYIGSKNISLGMYIEGVIRGDFNYHEPHGECSGNVVILSTSGSPLSGMNSTYGFCPECGTYMKLNTSSFMGVFHRFKEVIEYYKAGDISNEACFILPETLSIIKHKMTERS